MDKITKLLLLVIMLSMFLGCMSAHGKRFYNLVPHMFVTEIKRLNDLIDSGSGLENKIADVHLQLALLYSSYNNPKRDYSRALKEIEKYVGLEPQSAYDYEIQNLLNMLKSIESGRENRTKARFESENKKLVSKNKGLVSKNKKLASENNELKLIDEKLSEEIKQLNETIDKLKQLDVDLEKKRKSFK